MSDFNKRWSVASVFNVYGMNRHSTAEMLANAHRLPRALRDIDDQSTKAASVADCIRSLGYTVVCSWTEESGGLGVYRSQSIGNPKPSACHAVRRENTGEAYRQIDLVPQLHLTQHASAPDP